MGCSRKSEAEAPVEGLESDSQDDARQKKKKSKKRDLVVKQALSAPLEPQESATKSSITADRFKRRGRLVIMEVWEKESPKNIRICKSRLDPTKDLTYAKVYKVKDEDRLDFSEEEADVIAHDKVLDDGSQVLDEEQVSISV